MTTLFATRSPKGFELNVYLDKKIKITAYEAAQSCVQPKNMTYIDLTCFFNKNSYRMEREKQELRDYLEKDKKAMTDKMSAEEAERQRKEKEMAVCSIHSR